MANVEARKNSDGIIASYRIKVYKGRDNSGKRLKPYTMTWQVPEGKSEKYIERELNRAVTLFEQQCKDGFVADKKQSFSQYAEYVIDLKENVEKKKHRTIKRYRELLERINPAIGHLKLADIKPQHLNKFYEQLRQPGMNLITGKSLSDKTVLEHHRLIHTILHQAEKEMLVQYNAASKSTPPKYTRKEANHLEIEDVELIRKYLKNESLKWQVAINLLIFTGGRRGEVAGLTYDKIDFNNSTIEISQALLYSSDIGVYLDTTKSEAGNRILTIPDEIMQLVKKLVLETQELSKKMGDKWVTYPLKIQDIYVNSPFLLVQENGKPMHPDSITDYCKKFRRKYNKPHKPKNKRHTIYKIRKPKTAQKYKIRAIPKMNPHSFRHTLASILIYSGVDVVSTSNQLGHANSTVTQSIYSHLMKEANQKISNTLASVLLKK